MISAREWGTASDEHEYGDNKAVWLEDGNKVLDYIEADERFNAASFKDSMEEQGIVINQNDLTTLIDNMRSLAKQWRSSIGERGELQRLLDLITTMPVEEAAKILRRPPGSVRSMLHRLGMGGKTGLEWFTKFSLSRALHTRPDEIQKWIDFGWLKSRALSTAGAKANIIQADDFCQFVKEHGRAVASRRLTYSALWFVQNYVFPPSHAELLSVRGTYKKQDVGDETDANNDSQSASDSEEDSGEHG
jgi:hypothetical protein